MRPTEIIFLIDKSGSMLHHKYELYETFKQFLAQQQGVSVDCYITTELFSTHDGVMHMNTQGQASNVDVKTVCAKEKIKTAPLLHNGNYHPIGGTPILDAIGITIDRARFMISDDVNRQVILVLITDGQENSSCQYDPIQIAGMVSQLRKGGWKFIYIKLGREAIGYNQRDSKDIGPFQMGFQKEEYFEIDTKSGEFKSLMGNVTEAIADFRKTGQLELEWKRNK